MKARFAWALSMTMIAATAAQADTTIVDDNFDGYADSAAFRAVWVPTIGLGTAPSLPGDDLAGILTSDPLSVPANFPGVQGQAVDHIGGTATSPPEVPTPTMVNQWHGPITEANEATPAFQINPSATQSIFLSADIFDGASGNERMTVGLRHTNPEPDNGNAPADPDTFPDADTSNILELGFWNANPTVLNFPGAPQQSVGYAWRVINFGAVTAPIAVQPNWQFFGLPTELNRPTPVDTIVNIADIGKGWHRYTATITPTTVTLTIDLFRDGLRNTSKDPVTPGGEDRPGTPGVDAEVVLQVATLGAGFNNLHFGGPSGNSSPGSGVTGFDNIILKMVDVAAPVFNSDFDGSGTVDGKDFLIWQAGYGLTSQTTKANGDANGDHVVDNADLAVWATHFGGAPALATNAAVPEPASLAMAAMALAGLAAARRRS